MKKMKTGRVSGYNNSTSSSAKAKTRTCVLKEQKILDIHYFDSRMSKHRSTKQSQTHKTH